MKSRRLFFSRFGASKEKSKRLKSDGSVLTNTDMPHIHPWANSAALSKISWGFFLPTWCMRKVESLTLETASRLTSLLLQLHSQRDNQWGNEEFFKVTSLWRLSLTRAGGSEVTDRSWQDCFWLARTSTSVSLPLVVVVVVRSEAFLLFCSLNTWETGVMAAAKINK